MTTETKMYPFDNSINSLLDDPKEDVYWIEYLLKGQRSNHALGITLHRKEKSIAVPYVKIENEIVFLTVLNKKFMEWGFVSGTVERDESPIEAAIRELFEESKKMLSIYDIKNVPNNHFVVYDTKENESRFRKYNFFTFDVTSIFSSKQAFSKFETSFFTTQIPGREYNENICMKFQTIRELNKRKTWEFITSIVNKHFSSRAFFGK